MLLGSPHCLSTGTSGLCLPGPLYAHLPILCHNCVVHSCTFKRECWNAASWRTQFCFPFKSCMQCNCICLHQFAPLFGLFDTLWLCCNVCDFWGFNSVIHAAAAAGKPGILAVFAEDFLTERWGEDSEAGTSWILARTGKHWVFGSPSLLSGPFRSKSKWFSREEVDLDWHGPGRSFLKIDWCGSSPSVMGMLLVARFSIPCASSFILFQTWCALSSARIWLIFWISLLQ